MYSKAQKGTSFLKAAALNCYIPAKNTWVLGYTHSLFFYAFRQKGHLKVLLPTFTTLLYTLYFSEYQ